MMGTPKMVTLMLYEFHLNFKKIEKETECLILTCCLFTYVLEIKVSVQYLTRLVTLGRLFKLIDI